MFGLSRESVESAVEAMPSAGRDVGHRKRKTADKNRASMSRRALSVMLLSCLHPISHPCSISPLRHPLF